MDSLEKFSKGSVPSVHNHYSLGGGSGITLALAALGGLIDENRRLRSLSPDRAAVPTMGVMAMLRQRASSTAAMRAVTVIVRH